MNRYRVVWWLVSLALALCVDLAVAPRVGGPSLTSLVSGALRNCGRRGLGWSRPEGIAGRAGGREVCALVDVLVHRRVTTRLL